MRVPAAGGQPVPLTLLDSDRDDMSHRWPEFLPSGEVVVFSVREGLSPDEASLAAVTLESGEIEHLLQGGTDPQYVPSGHLLYGRGNSLMAVPFDADRLRVTGRPVAVIDGVSGSGAGATFFAASMTGALLYQTPARQQDELVLLDRAGDPRPLSQPSPEGRYAAPRFSPDGDRVAVQVFGGQGYSVWLYDLDRETLDPLTPTRWGMAGDPDWSADGTRVAFSTYRDRRYELAWTAADGSGEPQVLVVDESGMRPLATSSFSPDGKVLLYHQQRTGETEWDIVALPLDTESTPTAFIATQNIEVTAAFSPDGQWVAYASDEARDAEVYVQSYPGPGGKKRISTEGGKAPVWGPEGRELFYVNGDLLMVVEVDTGSVIAAGEPRPLFELAPGIEIQGGLVARSYDISPDGQHFVFVRIVEGSWKPPQRILVLNWVEELKRLVPTER